MLPSLYLQPSNNVDEDSKHKLFILLNLSIYHDIIFLEGLTSKVLVEKL